MSLHINQFVDRLKAADSRQQREFSMSMTDAKNLHADITKLLLALHELQSLQETARQNSNDIPEVTVSGGSF